MTINDKSFRLFFSFHLVQMAKVDSYNIRRKVQEKDVYQMLIAFDF